MIQVLMRNRPKQYDGRHEIIPTFYANDGDEPEVRSALPILRKVRP